MGGRRKERKKERERSKTHTLNPRDVAFSAIEKDHSPPPMMGPRTLAREAADWESPLATGKRERRGRIMSASTSLLRSASIHPNDSSSTGFDREILAYLTIDELGWGHRVRADLERQRKKEKMTRRVRRSAQSNPFSSSPRSNRLTITAVYENTPPA